MCVYPFLYVCVYVGSCFGKGLQISINCTVMFKLSNHICSSTRIQRKRVRISEREREGERERKRSIYIILGIYMYQFVYVCIRNFVSLPVQLGFMGQMDQFKIFLY